MELRAVILARMRELDLTPAAMCKRIGGARGKTVQNFLYDQTGGRCRSDVIESMLDDLQLAIVPAESIKKERGDQTTKG